MRSPKEIARELKLPWQLYRLWRRGDIEVVKRWARPRLDAFSYQQICRYLLKESGRYLQVYDDTTLT